MLNGTRDTNSTNWSAPLSVPSVTIRAIRVFPEVRAFHPCSSAFICGLALLVLLVAFPLHAEAPSDPVLDLLLQKGIVTEAEVAKAKADAERIRTNEFANLMPPVES